MEQDELKIRELLEKENAELKGMISDLRSQQNGGGQGKSIMEESEERLKIIFQYAPDAYYLSDLKGTFLDGNEAAEKMIGYQKEELLGRSFLKLDLLPISYMAKAAKLLAQNALGRPTGPDEFEIKRKDGSRIPVEISTYPVKIQDKAVVLGIARDISKHKELEEDLRNNKKQLDLILKNVNDLIIYLDTNNIITNVNHRIETVLGYKQSDVIGKSILKLGILSPQESLKVSHIFAGTSKETTFPSVELEFKKKDGTSLMVQANISIIQRRNTIEGFVIIAREISG